MRTIVICDAVDASPTEEGVFTLEGVRQRVTAQCFPWRVGLSVFLVLSSPRKGKYSGKVLVVNEASGRAIRFLKFVAAFEENHELQPVQLDTGELVFPEAGQYVFGVYFSAHDGEALKGEYPLMVIATED